MIKAISQLKFIALIEEMSNNIDWKLRNAALNGEEDLVSQLISQGATVDSESPATPL